MMNVEGIFFPGSFCSIYWLKNKGLMPGIPYCYKDKAYNNLMIDNSV